MAEIFYEATPFKESVEDREFVIGDRRASRKVILPVLRRANKVIRQILPYREIKTDILSVSDILQARDDFLEFGCYPHLNVPRLDLVQGVLNPDYSYRYLFVVDLIKGEHLFSKEFRKEERDTAAEVIEGFFISLTDYARDKYINGGWYLDQNIGQYVYGKGPEDLSDKVYFVDIEPPLDFLDNNREGSRMFFMERMVGFIGDSIKLLEAKLRVGPLQKARERYLSFLNEIILSGNDCSATARVLRDGLSKTNTNFTASKKQELLNSGKFHSRRGINSFW